MAVFGGDAGGIGKGTNKPGAQRHPTKGPAPAPQRQPAPQYGGANGGGYVRQPARQPAPQYGGANGGGYARQPQRQPQQALTNESIIDRTGGDWIYSGPTSRKEPPMQLGHGRAGPAWADQALWRDMGSMRGRGPMPIDWTPPDFDRGRMRDTAARDMGGMRGGGNNPRQMDPQRQQQMLAMMQAMQQMQQGGGNDQGFSRRPMPQQQPQYGGGAMRNADRYNSVGDQNVQYQNYPMRDPMQWQPQQGQQPQYGGGAMRRPMPQQQPQYQNYPMQWQPQQAILDRFNQFAANRQRYF